MENEVAATNQRTEALTPSMTAKSVAYLLAPSILFVWMALAAIYNAAGYKDISEGKTAVAYSEKFKRERDEMAAKIAAGRQEPTRQYMLACLDKSAGIESALQNGVTACAWSMQRIGFGVLLGVALQIYVILRLRAHYKKLSGGATAPS
jgi:hypothetical protein